MTSRALVLLSMLAFVPGVDGLVELTPAPGPGFPLPGEIPTNRGVIPLDASGRGKSAELPSSAHFRFFEIRDSERRRGFYFPSSQRLVRWRFGVREGSVSSLPGEAKVLVVRHGETWSHSTAFTAFIERDGTRGSLLRFAVPPGQWDLATLVAGYGPVFSLDLRVEKTADPAVPTATLEPAARLRGSVRESESGRAPARWEAYLDSLKPDDDSATAKFFAERPIDRDLNSIDFDSLPISGWELRVHSPGHATRTQRLPPARPGDILDVGNIYLASFGSLRVAISFPDQIPPGFLHIALRRQAIEPYRTLVESVPVGRMIPAKAESVAEFQDLEPGLIFVAIENEQSGLREEQEIQIEADREAQLDVSLRPRSVTGVVYRRTNPVPGAAMTLTRGGAVKYTAKSDDEGRYRIDVWSSGHYLLMTTLAEGKLPFAENIILSDDTRLLEHDVNLPNASISGIVRDSVTHAPIGAASVGFQNDYDPADESAIQFQQRSPVGSDGRYVFENLPNQSFRLTFSAPGYSPVQRSDIRPGEGDVLLDIDLTKGTTLSGTVVDGQGTGLAGVLVGVDTDSSGANFSRSTTSGADGRFSFDGVSEGSHTVAAFRCGYSMAVSRMEATTSPDRGAGGVVRLGPARQRMVIHFEDLKGSPIVHAAIGLVVNGFALPIEYPSRFALECGSQAFSDADGNLATDSLPFGSLVAVSPYNRQPMGTMIYDGSTLDWKIRADRATVTGIR